MTIFIFLIISITLAQTQLLYHDYPLRTNETKYLEVRKTIDLLEEGRHNVPSNGLSNLTLILGNAGSGKSTLIRWLFGDDEKLEATPTADGTFAIVDGVPPSELKTVFPDIVSDRGTSSAYYDCPEFSDARISSHEIAISYFLKRVVDQARNIKLVLVIDHSSVREGADRANFIKLLSRTTDLKNIGKFHHSIALIVTKVDNWFGENELKGFDGHDEVVIDEIAAFLTEVKVYLTREAAENDEDFTKKATRFLDILSMKNSDNRYVRIGIFRRPKKAGPLGEDPTLRAEKRHAKDILNSLIFSSKNDEEVDFSYKVSDGAKSDLGYIIQEIGKTIDYNLDKIGNKIFDIFKLNAEEGRRKLQSFVRFKDTQNVDDPHEIISSLKTALKLGMDEISRSVQDIKSLKNPSELPRIMSSGISNLMFNVPLRDVMVNKLSNQVKYFDFLQLLSNNQTFLIPRKSWAVNLENTARNMSILKADFDNFTTEIVENVTAEVGLIFSSLGRSVYEYHRQMIEEMKRKINLRVTPCIKLLYINPADVLKMKESVNKAANFIKVIMKSKENVSEKVVKTLVKLTRNESMHGVRLEKFLQFLNASDKIDDNVRKSWSTSFENEVEKMSNLNPEFEAFTNSMIEIVNAEIIESIGNWLRVLTNYYQNLAQQIDDAISSSSNASSSNNSNPYQVQRAVSELYRGLEAVSQLNEEENITNPIELAQKMQLFTSSLDGNLFSVEMANKLSCLHFLLQINNRAFTMPTEWVKMFGTAAEKLTELRDNYQRVISASEASLKTFISNLLNDVAGSIGRYYRRLINEVKTVDQLRSSSSFMFGVNATGELIKDIVNLPDVTMLADRINRSLGELRLDLPLTEVVESMERHCQYLNYLLIVSNQTLEWSWLLQQWNNNSDDAGEQHPFWSRNIWNVLVDETQNRIQVLLETFNEALSEFYRMRLNEVKAELRFFTLNSTCKEVDVSAAKEIAFELNNGLTIMSDLSTSIESLSTSPLPLKSILNNNRFNISKSEDYIPNVSLQIEILDFILNVSSLQFRAPRRWSTPTRNARKDLALSLANFIEIEVDETREKVYSLIKSDLEAVAKHIVHRFESKIISTEVQDVNHVLSSLKTATNEMEKLSSKQNNIRDLKLYVDTLECDVVSGLNIDKETINRVFKRSKYLDYMQAFCENESVEPFYNNNFQPFEAALNFLNQTHLWFTFLLELDEQLSRYEIQSNVSRYNVANLSDWGEVNKPQGISIDKTNFHQFLTTLNISGEIWDVDIIDSRLRALNNVLATNFHNNNSLKANCECRDNIIFEGNFIKFSDFVDGNDLFQSPCPFHTPNIDIFAAKTVFIDRNLIAIGSQLNISLKAPTWEVVGGNRSIVLDGIEGQPLDRADNGRYPGSRGYDGKAGLPGGAGGSFRGSGAIFVNGDGLFISVDGGRGGRGQDGGRGRDGKEGGVRFEDIISITHLPTVHHKGAVGLRDRLKSLGLGFSCGSCGSWRNEGGCVCSVFGRSGGKGGDGGKGGRGGLGGKAGRVEVIVELGATSSAGISSSAKVGSAGEWGERGPSGAPGVTSNLKLRYEERIKVHSRRRNDFTLYPHFEFIGYETVSNNFNNNNNKNSNKKRKKNRRRG